MNLLVELGGDPKLERIHNLIDQSDGKWMLFHAVIARDAQQTPGKKIKRKK